MSNRADTLYNKLRDLAREQQNARICLSYPDLGCMTGIGRRQAMRVIRKLIDRGSLALCDLGKGQETNCYVVLSPSEQRNARMRSAAELAGVKINAIAQVVFLLEQGVWSLDEVKRRYPVVHTALAGSQVVVDGRLWG